MKNKIFLIFAVALILVAVASINLTSADYSTACTPSIKLVNQDPNPAVPNDYVKVLFEVSGLENPACTGLAVKLVPEYPFSLDPGTNPVQTIAGSQNALDYKTTWNVPYKVRVANDALEGDYQLKLLYHPGNSEDFGSSYTEDDFNISILDSQTTFSPVIQASSGNQVSIGIVNTGKNTANSVIVGIPQQDNFISTGTTQQIVGNLAAGDYTIVSFTLTPRFARNGSRMQNQSFNMASQTIKIQIDYTDGIGKRRNVTEEIPFTVSLAAGNFTGANGRAFGQAKTTSSGITTFGWIFILALIVGGIYVYIKHGDKIKKSLKKDQEKILGKVPDWVTNERTRKKK